MGCCFEHSQKEATLTDWFSTRTTGLYVFQRSNHRTRTRVSHASLISLSLSERLTRLICNNAIQVGSKPVKTLQQEFPSPKFRQSLDLQCNLLVYVVYNVPCKGCPWNYVGETGDAFKPRKRSISDTKGSIVANHARQNNHSIDFDNACVIDKGNRLLRLENARWRISLCGQ